MELILRLFLYARLYDSIRYRLRITIGPLFSSELEPFLESSALRAAAPLPTLGLNALEPSRGQAPRVACFNCSPPQDR